MHYANQMQIVKKEHADKVMELNQLVFHRRKRHEFRKFESLKSKDVQEKDYEYDRLTRKIDKLTIEVKLLSHRIGNYRRR